MTNSAQATVVVCDASNDGARVCVALRSAGHDVIEASPAQLLTRAHESRARIVVVDADGEENFAAFRSLREDPSFGSVDVLLVSEARVHDRYDAIDLGASGLFRRPVDDVQVVRKVDSLASAAGALPSRAVPLATGREFVRGVDVHRRLGAAIADRESGHLVVRAGKHEWSFAVREGDLAFIASNADEHSFFAFLALRGVIARASRAALSENAWGQRAAMSAVALGLVQAEEIRAYLAGHADWLLSRFVARADAADSVESSWRPIETRALESYATDMVAFAARQGARLWIEAHRRAIEPERAFEALRGDFVLARGDHDEHLSLLAPEEHAAVVEAFEHPVTQIPSEPRSLRAVVIALQRLGSLRFVPRLAFPSGAQVPETNAVIRARIAARSHLVKEGDYFALLGVDVDASGHEIRRAYLELRRTLEPSRLPHELESLHDEVGEIVNILDEAYEVLRDNGRRERYRSAIAPAARE